MRITFDTQVKSSKIYTYVYFSLNIMVLKLIRFEIIRS